jgi:hypothetical protein
VANCQKDNSYCLLYFQTFKGTFINDVAQKFAPKFPFPPPQFTQVRVFHFHIHNWGQFHKAICWEQKVHFRVVHGFLCTPLSHKTLFLKFSLRPHPFYVNLHQEHWHLSLNLFNLLPSFGNSCALHFTQCAKLLWNQPQVSQKYLSPS